MNRDFRMGVRIALFTLSLGVAHAASAAPPTFTEEQATSGKGAYEANCLRCHGTALDNGQFAVPLKGETFITRWGGRNAGDFISQVAGTMPPGLVGSVDRDTIVKIVAYILQSNGVRAGETALPSEADKLTSMILPNSAADATPQPSRTMVTWPEQMRPETPALLKNLRPVTDEMLRAPSDDDWLSWRRTYDSHGFSLLKEINTHNVKKLSLVWSWSMAPGTVESTPLIHDGVMYVQSGNDVIQALDAATGDLLWSYTRNVSAADLRLGKVRAKRNMAIYGTTIFAGTSDAHMLAINAISGLLLWDQQIADSQQGWNLTAGPLVVKGKVIQGIAGRSREHGGGGMVVALDSGSGKELWRFNTVAMPGEPGGETWNGLPRERRSGGSVWTAGSYDPALNIVFFGTGNDYDIMPVQHKATPGSNIDLLYTDTTLALNPDTGKLLWYFQHMPNDLLDLDWAFERTILDLNGRKLVMTGGKLAIFDAVDAASGKFAFSYDFGLQNIVQAVDPITGAKKLNPEMFPEDGRERVMCPSSYGARNWMASSYDEARKILYVPLERTCALQQGLPSIFAPVIPAKNSDGKYGDLAAMDVRTGNILWREHVRHAQSSGVLATAGGVLFNTDIDRWLRANDSLTGAELWKVRLSDAANAFVITYAVKGKQYVAIAAGGSKVTMGTFAQLTPEVRLPASSVPVMSVFALTN
jgi:alcohol dehydrogenase (cytochrome c)